MNKNQARLRRATKTRQRIRTQKALRLSVYRTPRHIYAQIISSDGGQTLVSASTLDKSVLAKIEKTGNTKAAEAVGTILAEKAIAAGHKKVVFDRSGFRYHGRIKALADAAREAGMEF